MESLARTARHMPLLDRLDPLWNVLRPAYDAILRALYGRRGLVRVINGTDPIRLDPACRNVRAEYEPEVWTAAMAAVRADDVVVDVGANVGLYAVAFSRRAARVIAYEPDHANARLLRRTVFLNRAAVEVRQTAVGAEPGSARFRSDLQQSRFDSAGSTVVPVVTLDDELDRADLIKIDVEGYEAEVLDGARQLLRDPERRPRTIFLETHSTRLRELGLAEADVLRRLEESGYAVRELWSGVLTKNYRADAA